MTSNFIRFVDGPKAGELMLVEEFHQTWQVMNMSSLQVHHYEKASALPEEKGNEVEGITDIIQDYIYRRSEGFSFDGISPPREVDVNPDSAKAALRGELDTRIIRRKRDQPETDQPTVSDDNPGLTRRR